MRSFFFLKSQSFSFLFPPRGSLRHFGRRNLLKCLFFINDRRDVTYQKCSIKTKVIVWFFLQDIVSKVFHLHHRNCIFFGMWLFRTGAKTLSSVLFNFYSKLQTNARPQLISEYVSSLCNGQQQQSSLKQVIRVKSTQSLIHKCDEWMD